MDLKARLQDDMKSAMREQASVKLGAIRMVIAEIKKREIDKRGPLDEAEILKTLQTQIKQRNESVDAFTKGGRPDLADKEKAEIGFLQGYLPQQMNRQEMESLVASVITETQAQSPKDIGKVMKELSSRSQGRADGKILNEIARAKLSTPTT